MQLRYMAVSIESFYPKHCIFYSWKKMYLEMYAKKNSAYAEQCESSLYFPSIEKVQQKKVRKCVCDGLLFPISIQMSLFVHGWEILLLTSNQIAFANGDL